MKTAKSWSDDYKLFYEDIKNDCRHMRRLDGIDRLGNRVHDFNLRLVKWGRLVWEYK